MTAQTKSAFCREPLAKGIDVLEESVQTLHKKLLNLLLLDHTTKRRILWATRDYVSNGPEFDEFCEMLPELVTGKYATIIQPRITKTLNEQQGRTRTRAEVFTPAWICNRQNNLVDAQWFGRQNVFNVESGNTWTVTPEPVSFAGTGKSWKKYVDAQRLEVACGEAPYLVSRYDSVTGERIPISRRVGILDRKMRIVRENAETPEEWLRWAQRAFESVYGFEYQGDNLLLARENLFYSYLEYYHERFKQAPEIRQLCTIANIISWNLWQMDALKCVVPGSCTRQNNHSPTLFEYVGDTAFTRAEEPRSCPGCRTNDVSGHIGTYCRMMDWRSKCSRTFLSMRKGVRS